MKRLYTASGLFEAYLLRDFLVGQGIDTLEIPIDTTGTGLILSPDRVRVILPLRPIPDSSLVPRF